MASPLNKRFGRELRNNIGKYLALFLMMLLAIGFTSGYLLAASSIQVILEDMRDTYNVEDGRFITDFETDESTIEKVEALGCKVYKNYSRDIDLTTPDGAVSTARMYANRTEVDLPAYSDGKAPEGPREVAFDRVFSENHGLAVGDTVMLSGEQFTVSGICTLSDYQALFEDNSNFIFNAITFTVGQVSDETFESFSDRNAKYTYSFVLDDRNATDAERADFEEEVAKTLTRDGATLNDLIDSAANQGIGYALDDVTGDQTMWTVLLFLLIVIMGFVFVVLNTATIEAESAVIGTLLASGWRKRELIVHYMVLPACIGIIAAVVGVAIGFIGMADPMKNLYYHSYSIPPYVGTLNPRVIFITAVVPFILLMAITFIGLARKLRCTPLQFLRHETARRSKRHGVRLPEGIPFVSRFRLRVLLRNLSHFVTLFFGIMFASLLMLFGLCLMPVMNNYAEMLEDNMPAEHLYTLKVPLELDGSDSQREAYAAALKMSDAENITDLASEQGFLTDFLRASTIDEDANPVNTASMSEATIEQAEKYAVAQVETERALFGKNEGITVYGIQENSRYWRDIDVSDGKIWTTQGVLEKTKVKVGEPALFVDRFDDRDFMWTPFAATDSEVAMEVYMSIDAFNEAFDNDPDYFNGYASNEALELDGRYIASELTPADMRSIAEQMQSSMGNIVNMMMGMAVPIYLILVYLLTKTVIDRSARPISYMKVFGYHNREINKLYLNSITTTVMASLVISLPIIYWLLAFILKLVFMSYTGNFPLYISLDRYAIIIIAGALAYAVVAILHVRRIRRVSLAVALKVQE